MSDSACSCGVRCAAFAGSDFFFLLLGFPGSLAEANVTWPKPAGGRHHVGGARFGVHRQQGAGSRGE